MARRDRLRITPGATPGERRSPCLSNRGSLYVGRPGALSMSISTCRPDWAECVCRMASCGGPLAACVSRCIAHERVSKGTNSSTANFWLHSQDCAASLSAHHYAHSSSCSDIRPIPGPQLWRCCLMLNVGAVVWRVASRALPYFRDCCSSRSVCGLANKVVPRISSHTAGCVYTRTWYVPLRHYGSPCCVRLRVRV